MDLLELVPGTESGDSNKCKYKLRKLRREGVEEEEGPRKRGPKPRLRSVGMSR